MTTMTVYAPRVRRACDQELHDSQRVFSTILGRKRGYGAEILVNAFSIRRFSQ